MMDKLYMEDITPAGEVTKSRRNLVILSFSSIAYSILAPIITEIKLAGIEIRLADNNSILVLIIGGLAFESITFFLRFTNCHYAMRLSKMIDERISLEKDITQKSKPLDKKANQTTADTTSAIDLRSTIIDSWFTRLESVKDQQQIELKRILGQHRFVELHMPILLVSIALTLCISKLIN